MPQTRTLAPPSVRMQAVSERRGGERGGPLQAEAAAKGPMQKNWVKVEGDNFASWREIYFWIVHLDETSFSSV